MVKLTALKKMKILSTRLATEFLSQLLHGVFGGHNSVAVGAGVLENLMIVAPGSRFVAVKMDVASELSLDMLKTFRFVPSIREAIHRDLTTDRKSKTVVAKPRSKDFRYAKT